MNVGVAKCVREREREREREECGDSSMPFNVFVCGWKEGFYKAVLQ